jgi:hypothetical protein
LRGEGFCKVAYVSTANDGVSCDNKFVRKTRVDFLQGKCDSSAHTDTNHNMKNLRYQMIIGGNSFATVGIYGIDAGLLVAALHLLKQQQKY